MSIDQTLRFYIVGEKTYNETRNKLGLDHSCLDQLLVTYYANNEKLCRLFSWELDTSPPNPRLIRVSINYG